MVRHGMPEHDAEDVLQDAFVRASGARKWPPENVPLYPWMRRYANYQRLKHQAAGAKREAREQPDEHIDEHALERGPEDERAAGVARVARQLAADHHAQTLQMWEARAEGEPIVAIAADADVGEEAAKKRMQRFASAVRERWAEASAAAVAICAAILLYLHTLVPPPVPPPIGIDSQPRPLPTLPAPLGPAAIRREAFRRCVAAKTGEQWNACLAWLDRARQVDPEGEADPDVKELRARADNALDGKAPRREQPLRHPDGPQNP
jgi:DNA-directed RNA polymerase specialized sigma24 family protein